MKKLEKLSEIFEDKSSVLIFCSKTNIDSIEKELSEITGGSYGVFNVKTDKDALFQNAKSVYIGGKTFHFVEMSNFEKIIEKLK